MIGIGLRQNRFGAAGIVPFENTYSLLFDGVDDYVNTNYIPPTALYSSGFSLSAWIKPSSTTDETIIGQYAGGNRFYWRLYGSFYWIGFGNWNDWTTISSSVITGVWQYVVLTYNPSDTTIRIYLNGVLEDSMVRDLSSSGVPTSSLNIGAANSTGFLNGNIDEVSIWNTALSSGDVSTLWNEGTPTNLNTALGTTPVAWWRMGDSGTFFNSNWELPNQPQLNNWSSHSMEFGGVSSYIDCGNDNSLQPTGAITLSAWAKLDIGAFNDQDSLITQDHPAYAGLFNGYQLRWGQHPSLVKPYLNFTLCDDSTSTAYVISGIFSPSTPTPLNTWHHICGIWNGTTMELFFDGVSMGTLAFSGTITYNTAINTLIGGERIGFYHSGNIDEVSIFNSAKAIGDLWDGSGAPTDLSAESGLVAYYRMGESSNWNGTNWQLPDYSKNTLFSQKSFAFDGVDQHFRLGASLTSLGLTPTMSISIWVKMDGAFAGFKGIITNDQSGGSLRNWNLNLNYNQLMFQLWNIDGSYNFITDPTSERVQDNAWHHILISYDGTTDADGIKMWVDGSVVVSGTATSTGIRTSNASTFIGAAGWNGLSWIWDGNLDEASTWSEVKVPNDVRDSGTSTPIDLTGKSGLHSWTRMGEGGVWTTLWTLPDASENSYEAVSLNMDEVDLKFNTPTNLNSGLSDGMAIDDKVNNAPDNINQGLSSGMTEGDRVEDTPPTP